MRKSKLYVLGMSSFLVVSCLFLNCKRVQDITNDYRHTINYVDSTVYFYLSQKELKKKTDYDAIYYWYKNNKISSSQASYFGQVLNDEYVVINSDDALIAKGNYKLGLREGEWLKWNSEGILIARETYKSGKREGLQFYWLPDNLEQRTNFSNDKKDGKDVVKNSFGHVILKRKFDKGRLDGKEIQYDVFGRKELKRKYRNGIIIKEKNFGNFKEDEKNARVENDSTQVSISDTTGLKTEKSILKEIFNFRKNKTFESDSTDVE